MKKALAFLFLLFAGISAANAQDKIVLTDRSAVEGYITDLDAHDRVFYMTLTPEGDTLRLFVPKEDVAFVVLGNTGEELYIGPMNDFVPLRKDAVRFMPEYRNRYSAGIGSTVPLLDFRNMGFSPIIFLKYSRFFRPNIGISVMSRNTVFNNLGKGQDVSGVLLAIDPALASRIFVNNGNFFINADLGLSLQALAGAKGLYDRPFWVGLSLNVGLEFMLSKERNNAIEVGINFSNGGVFGGLSATVGYKFGK